MQHRYGLALTRGSRLVERDGVLGISAPHRKSARIAANDAATKDLLHGLAAGGRTAGELCRAPHAAHLHYLLMKLEARGLLSYTVTTPALGATAEPRSPTFRLTSIEIDGRYRLSRFACLRRADDAALIECPLGLATVFLFGPAAIAAAGWLCQPRTVAELSALCGAERDPVAELLRLLVSAGIAFPCSSDGKLAEDADIALRQWEFHDLMFHAGSRTGRTLEPFGGTFRFRDEIPPLPAVKPAMSQQRIVLDRADPAQADLAFFEVFSARRSVRTSGSGVLDKSALSLFLDRVARIQVSLDDSTQGAAHGLSFRPCPSGGAIHGIELYLTVASVGEVPAGLYHYDPLNHVLEWLGPLGQAAQALLADAAASAAMAGRPDVLITLAARFQRYAWKYQTVAYALILKDVGVLFQQMYLVATALGLAPCALGVGSCDLFAEAAGLNYFEESSVGEFMLSGATVAQ